MAKLGGRDLLSTWCNSMHWRQVSTCHQPMTSFKLAMWLGRGTPSGEVHTSICTLVNLNTVLAYRKYKGTVCPVMSSTCNFSGRELQLRPVHGCQGTHIFGQTDSVGLHTGELVGEGPVPTMLVGEILVPLFFLVDFFECCFCGGKTFLIVLFET